MGEIIGFISYDHFPPFFSPAVCRTPFPGADQHPSARAQLREPLCASVIVSTPMAAVCGPDPAIDIISRSLDDRTWV